MSPLKSLLTGAVLIALTAIPPASAQNANQQIPVIDGPTYLMTYVEVIPSANARAIAAMKEYRDAARKESGAMFADIYQEEGQSHRFVLSEIWQNRSMAAAHTQGAATTALLGKLAPIELGPTDVRIHQAHSVTPPKAPSANSVVVISHIDVAGGNTQNLIRAMAPLSEASQKENGMVRYEILDEVPAHANHFRSFEEWSNLAAFEAHNRSAHVQTYRSAVQPWLGTPYDQRLYKLVN